MSVPKSRRGESPAEYINLAREIYVFTYNRVRILPKSYTFYFSLPLYNAAREAYRLIKTANLIYIHNDADKQNRKELYERAQGYYNSMLDVLDLAYMNVNHEKLPSNVLKEWVKLITDELAQISKKQLENCLHHLRRLCAAHGIRLNEKKTQIIKLTRGFSFVKVRFRYGRTGKIVRKATYQGVRHMMQKLKIFRRWVDRGRMAAADVAASVTSWLGHMRRFHSYFAVQKVLRQYNQLFPGGTYGLHHLQTV